MWGKRTAIPWDKSYSPGALWEYRYSGTEANFDPKSWSCGMGEPSRDRHSGVWRPLEWGDSRPGWVGEAGALLKHQNIVLASADAFWPQDSSRDPEFCPVQDSVGRTAFPPHHPLQPCWEELEDTHRHHKYCCVIPCWRKPFRVGLTFHC